jgi:hypothetical protein
LYKTGAVSIQFTERRNEHVKWDIGLIIYPYSPRNEAEGEKNKEEEKEEEEKKWDMDTWAKPNYTTNASNAQSKLCMSII